ncbi:MAG: helix-turn-helix domain-containing protein [Propionibacteriaceae bacterium]|jgi:hypothetical protein|nr:helix-turn-helix domain-containing protein [Propionibacteriaceae bacterium]
MPKICYTVAELALETGMSQDRIRAHCLSGDFGFQNGTKVWVISHASFQAWLDRKDKEATGWRS